MKVLSVAGCVAIEQEQQANSNNNAMNASDADVTAAILKSVEIQSMLRPLAVVDDDDDIDQTERSITTISITPTQRCIADDYAAIASNASSLSSSSSTSDAEPISTSNPAAAPVPRHPRLPGISEVLPTLFLCGAGVAIPCFIEQLGVTCVVNAAPELPDTPLPDSRPLYYQVPVLDRGDIDLKYYFDEVADMIEQVRQAGGRSLVHCVAGVSRSASLCIAYLMKHGAMSLRQAFEHVRRVRPQIRPNVGFFRQLIEYERLLHGRASVQFIFVESLAQEIPDVYEPEYRAMEVFYQKHRHVKRR